MVKYLEIIINTIEATLKDMDKYITWIWDYDQTKYNLNVSIFMLHEAVSFRGWYWDTEWNKLYS